MEPLDLVRRMIEQGSDALAAGLHARLCADRTARVPAPEPSPPSWEDLAGQALRERILLPEEVGLLLRRGAARTSAGRAERPACDEPGP